MATTHTDRSRLLLETATIDTIPVLTIAPSHAERCPAIFFISGFGRSKADGLPLGYQLAQAGFFFISFDAWLHGSWASALRARSSARGGRGPQTFTIHPAIDPKIDDCIGG